MDNTVKDLRRKLDIIEVLRSFAKFKGISLSEAIRNEIADIEFQAAVEGISK